VQPLHSILYLKSCSDFLFPSGLKPNSWLYLCAQTFSKRPFPAGLCCAWKMKWLLRHL
jgi:hypothetical protein